MAQSLSAFERIKLFLNLGFGEGISQKRWELAFEDFSFEQLKIIREAIYNVVERKEDKESRQIKISKKKS